jgi:hypothetical protein
VAESARRRRIVVAEYVDSRRRGEGAHVAVQTGCAGFAADVSDAVVEQVPVEAEAELLAFVGLDLIDRERQL